MFTTAEVPVRPRTPVADDYSAPPQALTGEGERKMRSVSKRSILSVEFLEVQTSTWSVTVSAAIS
jgi:hypothetical protein